MNQRDRGREDCGAAERQPDPDEGLKMEILGLIDLPLHDGGFVTSWFTQMPCGTKFALVPLSAIEIPEGSERLEST